MDFRDFILEHENDDTSRLLLSRDKWPEIDISLAVSTIESRRKLRDKVPAWYAHPELTYPRKLSAEQCSSEETAALKARIAGGLANDAAAHGKDGDGRAGRRLADLTGGLGVDTAAFCAAGFEVLYNEMDQDLYDAARSNLPAIGCGGVTFRNTEITDGQSVDDILGDFIPDIIFLDPARRADDGRKVFLLEECRPDVLKLKDKLLEKAETLMIKLSPMADIDMVCSRLGPRCRQMHIMASRGECRELLAVMRRDGGSGSMRQDGGESLKITVWEGSAGFSFSQEEKQEAAATYLKDREQLEGAEYLFEPGKAMMKSGAFNLIGSRFSLIKMAESTHLYLVTDATPDRLGTLMDYGKVFRIISTFPLSNAGIREAAGNFPSADVTARNVPMTSDVLKSRLCKAAGKARRDKARNCTGSIHLFGVKCLCGGLHENVLLATSRVTLPSDASARTHGSRQ